MFIQLAPYNPYWQTAYSIESERIALTMPMRFSIEHIGSTSVPLLCAKPVIDIIAGLTDFENDTTLCVVCLQNLGYTYHPDLETGMPNRRFFTRCDTTTNLSFNLHVVAEGSKFWQRHLLFRNYLRQHVPARIAYEQLKQNLAQREWDNTGEYAEAKTPFIRAMETAAKSFFAAQ